jgi:hypothetical protein
MGRTLVLLGLGIAALGLLIMLGVPIGRLPGDFYVRRGSVSFYFPLATSIVLSVLLTGHRNCRRSPSRAIIGLL